MKERSSRKAGVPVEGQRPVSYGEPGQSAIVGPFPTERTVRSQKMRRCDDLRKHQCVPNGSRRVCLCSCPWWLIVSKGERWLSITSERRLLHCRLRRPTERVGVSMPYFCDLSDGFFVVCSRKCLRGKGHVALCTWTSSRRACSIGMPPLPLSRTHDLHPLVLARTALHIPPKSGRITRGTSLPK